MNKLLHWLALPFEWLLALVILFEEWGWGPLQRCMARLARWPAVASVERRIGALPPMAALPVFALPSLLLLPVNLFALWLAGEGRAALGTALIVAAKLVGTSLVARIFTLTRPALLELPWFARLYRRWQSFEAALLAPIRASWVWRTGRAFKRRWAEWRMGRLA
ncbi:hypothetical protein [Methylomagnum sp.]